MAHKIKNATNDLREGGEMSVTLVGCDMQERVKLSNEVNDKIETYFKNLYH